MLATEQRLLRPTMMAIETIAGEKKNYIDFSRSFLCLFAVCFGFLLPLSHAERERKNRVCARCEIAPNSSSTLCCFASIQIDILWSRFTIATLILIESFWLFKFSLWWSWSLRRELQFTSVHGAEIISLTHRSTRKRRRRIRWNSRKKKKHNIW